MNRQEFINSIKEDLEKYQNLKLSLDEKIEINMVNAILKDGTTLYTDDSEFKVGSVVYNMDESGAKTDVKDGDYEGEDGTMYTIVGSAITVIESAATEAIEPATEEPVVAPTQQAGATLDDVMAAVAKLQASFDSMMTDMTAQKTEQAEVKVNVTENETKLSEIELKLEKVLVEKENRNVNPIDLSDIDIPNKPRISYDQIRQINRKF